MLNASDRASARSGFTMDTIFLHGLRLDAMVGVYAHERVSTNPVEIDLDFGPPGAKVYASGELADTIDYASVTARISQEIRERRFGLLEEMAARIADILLGEFGAPWVRVRIVKIGILKEVARVGVSIERRALQSAGVLVEALPSGGVSEARWRDDSHRTMSAAASVHVRGLGSVTESQD